MDRRQGKRTGRVDEGWDIEIRHLCEDRSQLGGDRCMIHETSLQSGTVCSTPHVTAVSMLVQIVHWQSKRESSLRLI